jgi:glycosyltransferase involved in cell wall biosynthesis
MKSLIISCVSLTCGGAEKVISILSSKFAEHFDSVKIVMWKDAPVFYKIDERVEITSIEKEIQSSNYLKKILWFRKFTKQNNPSIILSFLAKSSVGVILSQLGLKRKVIVAERNDPRYLKGGKPMIWIRDFLYTFATGILEQTESNKHYFKGKKLSKTNVIYNPVFMDAHFVGIANHVPRKKNIVSVGRLEPQKNHSLLINAFSEFHKKNPDYNLTIFGEGNERAKLENQIKQLQLNNCVNLPGNTTNVFDSIKDACAFVLPSNFEGMPNALIESMCLGIPSISTKVSGAIDLIKNEENGILINIGSKSELIGALERVIFNKDLSNKLSSNAPKLYEQLSVDNIASHWINYLSTQLKEKP